MMWVQHGYGKGDRLDQLFRLRHPPTGVVLSPNDESPTALSSTAAAVTSVGGRVLIDPQTYVYSIPEGTTRLHHEHDVDFGPLDWAMSPTAMEDHVRRVIQLNNRAATQQVIAPGPLQGSFADVWTPISFQYARATADSTDLPVIASLVLEESALGDWQGAERWLDRFTSLDIHGAYVIFARSDSTYPPLWDPDRLANALRLVHRLGVVNQYEVLWAYADVVGLAGVAAGAQGTGNGWFYTLRNFTASKWIPSTGGRQPQPRVFAEGLLSALYADSEGEALARTDWADEVFWEESVRNRLSSGDQWGQTDSWIQFLSATCTLDQRFSADGGTHAGIDHALEFVIRGIALYDRAAAEGLTLERSHRTRLETMRRSLESFASLELG